MVFGPEAPVSPSRNNASVDASAAGGETPAMRWSVFISFCRTFQSEMEQFPHQTVSTWTCTHKSDWGHSSIVESQQGIKSCLYMLEREADYWPRMSHSASISHAVSFFHEWSCVCIIVCIIDGHSHCNIPHLFLRQSSEAKQLAWPIGKWATQLLEAHHSRDLSCAFNWASLQP